MHITSVMKIRSIAGLISLLD